MTSAYARNGAAKVLIIGFSVTADNDGYISHVKRYFESDEDIFVDYCGVGGVTPFCLHSALRLVNDQRGPYTHVFLEIATSIYFKTLRSITFDAIDLLYDLLHQIQTTGAKIAFINLYRDDFDYNYQYFNMIIECISRRYELPMLDLAWGLVNEGGREFCRSLLRDSVHTSEKGAEFQGAEVIRFVQRVCSSNEPNKTLPQPRYKHLSIALAKGRGKSAAGSFRRSGLEVPYVAVLEGATEEIEFVDQTKVTGLAFLSGPKAGRMIVRFNSVPAEITIDAYDEHCFYERYNFYRFKEPVVCTSMSVTQLPGLANIPLRKGEPDDGPRIGRVIAAHVITECENELGL